MATVDILEQINVWKQSNAIQTAENPQITLKQPTQEIINTAKIDPERTDEPSLIGIIILILLGVAVLVMRPAIWNIF